MNPLPLSESDLDAIEQRANDATEGPWTTSGPDTIAQWMIYDAEWAVASATAYSHDRPIGASRGPGYIDTDANAAFIAHARSDVPALVAEVRRIRALAEEWDDGVSPECSAFAELILARESVIPPKPENPYKHGLIEDTGE